MSLKRVPPDLLRRLASSVTDTLQHDEMAGPSYLHANPLIRWVFWKRLEVVTTLLMTSRPRREAGLDFGCGLGVLLPTLSTVTDRVFATDLVLHPSRQLVSELGIENVTFVEPSRLAADVAPRSLDYVVSTDVLEHVDDLDVIIEQFASLLKTSGRLVVSGPTENWLYKTARVLAGFGGKGDYHHTDIHRIHACIRDRGAFRTRARRALPVPRMIEGFLIYSYERI